MVIPEGYVLSDVQYDGKTAYWLEVCPDARTLDAVATSTGGSSGSTSHSGTKSEPKKVIERSVTRPGFADASQVEIPVVGNRKASVVAGGITIFEDGSVQMPRMGVVE